MSAPIGEINNLAQWYDISRSEAARVYEGEANVSVERGYYESL